MGGKDAVDLLTDLGDHAARLIESHPGITPEEARDIAVEIVAKVSTHWGGQQIYIPKQTAKSAEAWHREMYEEFNGKNAGELAEKYGCSLVWVYVVIKRMRIQDLMERQRRLASDDGRD